MSKKKVYHITKTPEGWQGKLSGAKKASSVGKTKDEVIKRITAIARNAGNSVVKIHGIDKKVQQERKYN
jgi:hypothetical protein